MLWWLMQKYEVFTTKLYEDRKSLLLLENQQEKFQDRGRDFSFLLYKGFQNWGLIQKCGLIKHSIILSLNEEIHN